ncbi:unnamed protein product [Rotaria magnacalcarata]|uniref:Uncharacterized protein n=1 Tax=Rotaria magnacalcarata TaxID=392030 RepID=A0A820LSZ5_9BILA|nr:unnamed protein product [Rotaria magnacalcarata]CAF4362310.1 unnamed protein product [Rotaria magnacalcarata]
MLNNRRSLKKTIFDCSVEADNILEILQDAIDLFIDEYSDSDEEYSESDNEESSESDNEESSESDEEHSESESDNEDSSKKVTYQLPRFEPAKKITEDDLERLEQAGLFDEVTYLLPRFEPAKKITEDDLERLFQSGLFDQFLQYSKIGYGQQFLDRLRETYESKKENRKQ